MKHCYVELGIKTDEKNLVRFERLQSCDLLDMG